MPRLNRDKGAALITGLILMVVLMLLVTSAMRTTIMEERMTGNARDADVGFQAAEAALREGEQVLNGATLPPFTTNGAYLNAGTRDDNHWLNTHDWATNSQVITTSLPNTAAAPRFVIEQVSTLSSTGNDDLGFGPKEDGGVYRVTARAQGANPNTFVYLQSTFQRQK